MVMRADQSLEGGMAIELDYEFLVRVGRCMYIGFSKTLCSVGRNSDGFLQILDGSVVCSVLDVGYFYSPIEVLNA